MERSNLTYNERKAEATSTKELAQGFLNILQAKNSSVKKLENALRYSKSSCESLMIVSTVCPPYSTDSQGVPTYRYLGEGIAHNIKQHLEKIPPGVELLKKDGGIDAKHIFLMADTEVDLAPFLQKRLQIDSVEFLRRCQISVEEILAKVKLKYPNTDYNETPQASRFLSYFGEDNWYLRYGHFKKRLEEEASVNEDVARSLRGDGFKRLQLIETLLGSVTEEEMIGHIVRQKAQYMAFASLMRERFPNRLVVVNHATPNFAWMNDKLAREPLVLDQSRGNYLPEIPLVELDISTMPGGER